MGLIDLAVPNLAAIGQVRRKIRGLTKDLGFSPVQISELEIASTELATNLIKNGAIDGKIVVRLLFDRPASGIEMVSLDSGPGIANVDAAIRDHYSTCDTSGLGLGAISRLMNEFDIFSHAGTEVSAEGSQQSHPLGTIVTCRKWVKRPPKKPIEHCILSRPCPGETANGDGYVIKHTASQLLVAVVDGVGHGEHAEEASQRALDCIDAHFDAPFTDIFSRLHDLLRKSRGAVVTLVRLDHDQRTLEHAGVGNVEVRTYPREKSGLMTQPGTLGFGQFKQPRITKTVWPVGTALLIHTDGISQKWSLDRFPDLLNCRVSTIAHYLMHNFRLQSDDSTIVVLRG